ncbi:hypothetical protein [Dyella sp. A6]|uniref:hypothetical protein n=1 Tax=Dyella aluminiiresistens TaxID=3069105 RepID=UPI002E798F81|nr:hypothetical protein [Dyella sp. A6]
MTESMLALLSSVIWWVLYSSISALFCALVAWVVLRWCEQGPPVFNRVYLACLLWTLLGVLLVAGVAIREGHVAPPYTSLLASGLLRVVLVIEMLVGALLLWRLVPRYDKRRIRLTSACLAVAVVMAIIFGIATSLGVT